MQFFSKVRLLIILGWLLSFSQAWSEKPYTLTNSFTTSLLNSGGDGVPLWLYGRQEGHWHPMDKTQWLNALRSSFEYRPTSSWRLNASAHLDYQTVDNNLYFHTAEVAVKYQFLSLRVGRHLFSPLFTEANLGSGSYLFGDNYRPVPRVTAEIPYYTPLPYFLNVIEIRGGISHGKLDDNWDHWHHNNELLHEKYAYFRVNTGKLKPYVGISHSALLGGYNKAGESIPVDFWKSFFAKSSDKIGGGDATNAAGAHMGLYDVGAYFSAPSIGEFHFYYQSPFSDSSGMWFLIRNTDHQLGINWISSKSSFIHHITLEIIQTSYQSGSGMPDFVDDNGKVFTAAQMKEMGLDEFMRTKFGETKDTPYTEKEVFAYLREAYNRGHSFGGRDGYMSNHAYPSGWTYYGQIMGSPLNLTQYQLKHKNPELGTSPSNLIVNDRYKAIHLGLSGSLNPFLQWRFKATYSKNYGSYYQQYPGRYTWNETENYFFAQPLHQAYTMLGANWKPKNIPNLIITSDLGLDFGEIFKSYGVKLGASFTF